MGISKIVGIVMYILFAIRNYTVMDSRKFRLNEVLGSLVIIAIVYLIIYAIEKIITRNIELLVKNIGAFIIGEGISIVVISLMMWIEYRIVHYFASKPQIANDLIRFLMSLGGLALLVFFTVGAPVIFLKIMEGLALRKEFVNRKILENNFIEKQNNILDELADEIEKVGVSTAIHTNFVQDKEYSYDKNLELIKEESKKIWFNNDEKEEEIEKLLEEVKNIENNIEIIDFDVFKYKENLNNLPQEYIKFLMLWKNKERELKSLIENRENYYKGHLISAKLGADGENKVNEELNEYVNIYNLPNIRLEIPDREGNLQSIENDNILITRQGVFIIEVKNIGSTGSYNIKVEKDGRWIKEFKNGSKEIMNSATEQNNRHLKYINKVINKVLNREIENYLDADGIVVLANKEVTIDNQSEHQKIVRVSEIYPYIKTKPNVLTLEEMDRLKNYFEENNLEGKKFPVSNYIEETKRNIDIFNKKAEKMKKCLNVYLVVNDKLNNVK